MSDEPTLGACRACRAVYEWKGKPLLREAFCPVHPTQKLLRTTYHNRWARKPLEMAVAG